MSFTPNLPVIKCERARASQACMCARVKVICIKRWRTSVPEHAGRVHVPARFSAFQSADPAPHALRDLLLLPSSSRRVQRSSCGSASELERLGRSTKKSKNSHAQRQNPGLMLGIRELKDLGPLGDELRAARGPDCRGGGGREEGRGEGPNPQREENVCVTHPPPQTKFSFSLRGSLWKMKMMKISAVLHQKKRLLRG